MNALPDAVNRLGDLWWPLVLHATWQGALVGAVVLAVVTWGRRIPAPLRYGLLVLALVKFLVPPMSALPFGLIQIG